MSVYSDSVLSHVSLRFYARLGESAGTTLDDIGPNNLDGTYAASGITYGVSGALLGDPSTAVTFAGTSDPASVPDNNALDLGNGPLSVECWIKRGTIGTDQHLVSKAGTGGYELRITSGNVIVASKSGGSAWANSTGHTLTDTTAFHHIVITKDAAARKIWLDGVDVTTLTTDQTLSDTTSTFRLGYSSAGANRFPGSMDEVAIYGAVLTPAEVLEHYELGTKNPLFASQTFTANGDFVVPAGVERVHVECRGGGGGGGTATINAGGGGGGGAFAKSRNITVVPGNAYAVTVGQGGTGAGGSSTFNSTTVVAVGGGAGGNGSAGGAGTAGAAGTAASSTGQIKKSGGAGAAGTGITTGGGGGGGAGDNTDGGAASGGTAGAAGSVGGGAGGAGAGVPAAGSGTIPGGGGGGATATGARGSGARGAVVVSWVEVAALTSTSSLTDSDALAETSVLTSVSSLAEEDSLAETSDLTSVAVLEALDSLAETVGLTSVMVGSGTWQRISPGLSGIAYNSTGTSPVSGAQVLVFRDDTNALIATLTSDGSGNWATELDPNFSYWISYHKAGSPQIEDRTDRAIPTVETSVETGTLS